MKKRNQPSFRNGENDKYTSVSNLQNDLNECLGSLKSPGSFSVFDSLPNAPNPGLYFREAGIVGLPLSDRDAQVIVAASREAPFGKGEKTIVDTNIRKTWEVSPNDFEIRNPAWESFINSVVTQVSAGLGMNATGKGVNAELYKLLLYEEGAMFKPHQDSEKAPRMFGTLVIALPSKHEGGEVRVTHAGKTKILETFKFSEFGYSYLAWFSDVTHEVKPVTSGRRLVLTYNLTHNTLESKELAANSNKGMANLRDLFSRWKNNIEAIHTSLAYLFEHQYTDASLCFAGLKGHDQHVTSHLREICEEFGFCLYLANLEKSIEGGCDEDDWGAASYHEIIEECNREVSLKRVVDLDGTEIAKDLDFDEKTFIQPDPLGKAEPDDEDYSGYTGNEGVSATHFYHRTVAIILPRKNRVDFLLAPKKDQEFMYTCPPSLQNSKKDEVTEWLERLRATLTAQPDDTETREDLEQICKLVIREMNTWTTQSSTVTHRHYMRKPAPFSDDVLAEVLATTVDINDKSLFLAIFELCADTVDPVIFEPIGTALLRYDLKDYLPQLSSQLQKLSGFASRITAIKKLNKGLQIEKTRSSNDRLPYKAWLKSQTDLAITSMNMINPADGECLAELASEMTPHEIFNRLLPAAKRNSNHTLMLLSFLAYLLEACASEKLDRKIGDEVFKDVFADLIQDFNLISASKELDESVNNRLLYLGPFAMRSSVGVSKPVIDPNSGKNIAMLLCACSSLGLKDELNNVVLALCFEATQGSTLLFPALFIPLLSNLHQKLRDEQIVIVDSLFPQLFQGILSAYIVRDIQAEPKTPKDWARRGVKCNCRDCHPLNEFLRDPARKVAKFPIGKQRRRHLQEGLQGSDNTHETERTGNPQSLVVTKTRKIYEASHKAWKERCDFAKQHLESFGDSLKDLLPDYYEPIMALDVDQLQTVVFLVAPPSAVHRPFGKRSSNHTLPPITKRKVPAGVIVIDDD